MCKYCDLDRELNGDKYGDEFETYEPSGSEKNLGFISHFKKANKYILVAGGNFEFFFEINNCPMCGRKLGENNENS